MCGIFGIVEPGEFKHRDLLHKAGAQLLHRGPDAQGNLLLGGVGVYHTRLSIQDIACGAQPMQLEELTIVFNGEIYNHFDLRNDYRLNCETRSDTETILHLYKKLGKDCVRLLDGMFAFAIHDANKRTVLLARDKAGEKPLYYYIDSDNTFLFSSELNALYAGAPKAPELSSASINEFLQTSFFCGEETPYQDVKELLPGTFFEINLNSGEVITQAYWSSFDSYTTNDKIYDEKSALDLIENALQYSVDRQLETSDIEVGAYLSGGIDSGLVSAFAKRKRDKFKTFTVRFENEFDEGELAKLTADHIGSSHHELNIDFSDLTQNIEEILGAYGEPFSDSSSIPSWYVAREAKKYVTVILTGDGADELFGGYRRHVPQRYIDVLKERNNAVIRLMADGTQGFGKEHKSRLNYVHRLLKSLSRSPVSSFLASTTDTFNDEQGHFVNRPKYKNLEFMLEEVLGDRRLSPLDKALIFDFTILLPGILLPKVDIASMQHAVETRAPFLGGQMLNLAGRISSDLKIKGVTTKYLLRKLAEQHLPQQITKQPKRGFEIPLVRWMDGVLKPITHDLLRSNQSISRDFLDGNYIQGLLDKSLSIHPQRRAKQLFLLLSLEIWDRKRRSLRN